MTDELDPRRPDQLLQAAAALPREVEPSHDAWPAIRERIDAQRVRSIAPEAPGGAMTRPARYRWAVAAAAVVVVAAGVMTLARPGAGPERGAAVGTTPVVAPIAPLPDPSGATAARTVPVTVAGTNPGLAAALDQYRAASRELEAEVAEHAATLSPATREVVRRSLATIDTAIADLRAALGDNPRDIGTGQALSLVYERKLEFLKRVRALPAAGM